MIALIHITYIIELYSAVEQTRSLRLQWGGTCQLHSLLCMCQSAISANYFSVPDCQVHVCPHIFVWKCSVCVLVCVCVCVRACVHACVHVGVYVGVCACVCVHACVCVYVHAFVCVCSLPLRIVSYQFYYRRYLSPGSREKMFQTPSLQAPVLTQWACCQDEQTVLTSPVWGPCAELSVEFQVEWTVLLLLCCWKRKVRIYIRVTLIRLHD